MAIIDLQRRQTEVGRIRLGQKVTTSSGKTAPSRLETFRFTSASKPLIEAIARLYGGEVRAWTPPKGAAEWEVITTSASVPVYVPPQDVDSSQFYELWSKGGCQRRCTGARELIGDTPCVCDPTNRECSMHTRVNLMLRDVPGIGVWRLETGGYYAAVELPGMVELLARAQGLVTALLELRQRTVTREGKTMHFVVPVLHVEDFTPGQLIAGEVSGLAVGAAPERRAIAAADASPAAAEETAATPAPPPAAGGPVDWKARFASASTMVELRRMWTECAEARALSPETKEAWFAAGRKLRGEEPEPQAATAAAEAAAVDGEPEPDRETTWAAILAEAGKRGWNTAQASAWMRETVGHNPTDADGWTMAQALDVLKSGAAQ